MPRCRAVEVRPLQKTHTHETHHGDTTHRPNISAHQQGGEGMARQGHGAGARTMR
jgi:hypothetical protein